MSKYYNNNNYNVDKISKIYYILSSLKCLDRYEVQLKLYYNNKDNKDESLNKIFDILERRKDVKFLENNINTNFQIVDKIFSMLNESDPHLDLLKSVCYDCNVYLHRFIPFFFNYYKDLKEIDKDIIRKKIIDQIASINEKSIPLAFDIISLNGNVEIINSISTNTLFEQKLLLPSDSVKNIIHDLKGLKFTWLKNIVNKILLNSGKNFNGTRLCILDVASISRTSVHLIM